MLIITVARVRVSHAGMKMFGKLVPVVEILVAPLVKRETPQLSAAKPSMIIVSSISRRGEALLEASTPCDAS
jgi:hypothetical protein